MLTPLRFVAIALAAACGAAAARADEHGARVPLLPAYQKECSDCHVAYPPGLLPAASWQRLLGGLGRHFGTDASLDPATQRELLTWLPANAGTRKRAAEAPPEDRISRAAWFVREHREVPADTWKRASIKTAANCAACHQDAAQGRFDEHGVRIPR
jgi:Dihaem cytochrome c